MADTSTGIIQRFEAFGHSLFGDQHGWKKKYADALDIAPAQMSSMLNGTIPIGGTIQSRLRELGADVEYILTGKTASAVASDKEIRTHYSGNPTEELKQRVELLGNWILSYGQDADPAYIGFVTQKILEGKILDSNGHEISRPPND